MLALPNVLLSLDGLLELDLISADVLGKLCFEFLLCVEFLDKDFESCLALSLALNIDLELFLFLLLISSEDLDLLKEVALFTDFGL